MDNYIRFEKDIDGLMKALSLRPRDYESISEDALQCINLHICNILSSARTYVDHQETRIKRKYGESSKEVGIFTAAKSQEYDNAFPYRFMYHLRNYIQHCGLPAATTGVQHKLVDRVKGEVEMSMSPCAIKSQLLQQHRWKEIILKDLESLPENIELAPILHEYVECLKRIHASTVGLGIEEVRGSVQYFESLAKLHPEDPKVVSLFTFDVKHLKSITLTQQKIPLDKIGIIRMSTNRYNISL
jgi:hypothetical protein